MQTLSHSPALKFLSYWLLVFSLNSLQSLSQGQWVCEKQHAGANGISGTLGLSAPNNVPPKVYEGCEFQGLQGNFWLYGGSLGLTTKGDMWRYDPSTNEWTWVWANAPISHGTKGVSHASNSPGPRGWGTATWVDNNGKFWLFAGSNGASGGSNPLSGKWNNLWKYDPVIGEWTWMHGPNSAGSLGDYGSLGVMAPNNLPPSRDEFSATWKDLNGDLWFYGGSKSSSSVFFGDLWKYTISANQWTWMGGSKLTDQQPVYGSKGVPASTNFPGSREVWASWTDSKGDFWLYGGKSKGASPAKNDLWKYSPASGEWTWLTGDSAGVTNGTFAHQCTFDDANIPPSSFENRSRWIDDCDILWVWNKKSLWKYNPDLNKWAWVNGITTPGPPYTPPPVYGTVGVPASTNFPGSKVGLNPWISEAGLWMFSEADLWRYIPDAPDADYSYLTNPCDLTVDFMGTSNPGCNTIKSFFWDFGDGNTSSQENVQHTYTYPGSYQVKLRIQNCTWQKDSIVKTIVVNNAIYDTVQIAACDSALINGNWRFTSLTLTDTIKGNLGTCDTIKHTQVFINYSKATTDSLIVCNGDSLPATYLFRDSILIHGNYENVAGTYTKKFLTPSGCDSVSNIVLVSEAVQTYTNTFSGCDSIELYGIWYFSDTTDCGFVNASGPTAPNCPSLICIELVVLQSNQKQIDTTLSPGESLQVGSITITEQGNYIDSLTNKMGCDSIIFLKVLAEKGVAFYPNTILLSSQIEANKVFSIVGESIEHVELSIFNKWGQRIFSGSSWDGKISGEMVKNDVYIFTATITFLDGSEKLIVDKISVIQ